MAKIQIYGKTYNVKSSSDEISAEEVAAYVDSKMRDLAEARSKIPTLDIAVLAALNIAQEFMELRKQSEAKNRVREDKIGRMLSALEDELQAVDR